MTTGKLIPELDAHPAGTVSSTSELEIHRKTSLKSERVSVSQLLQSAVGPEGPVGPAGPTGPAGDDGTGVVVQGDATVAQVNSWDSGTLNPSEAWLMLDAGTITTGSPSITVATGDMILWTAEDKFINLGPIASGPPGESQIDETGGPGAYGTLTGLVNDSNTVFTTSQPYKAGSLRVIYYGQVLSGSNITETTPASGVFTLGFAPATGTWVQAAYDPE